MSKCYPISEDDLDLMFKLLADNGYPVLAGQIVYRTKERMKNIREKLAELEHIQWAHWTKYMLDNLTTENIKRWKQQVKIAYQDLSEKEKDADRKWADKVIAVIEGG
jgi:hypothetical protein